MAKWNNVKDTKTLLSFIIKQELELSDYDKLKKLIPEKFMICKRGGGITNYTNELVDTIVDWENGNQDSSLEKLIETNFLVFINT